MNQTETVYIGGNTRGSKLSVEDEAKKSLRAGVQSNVELKPRAGQNTKSNANVAQHINRVDELTEPGVINYIGIDLGRKICEARTAKGMTQKELAGKCNVIPTSIQEMENGKALYDAQLLTKVERHIGRVRPQKFKKVSETKKSGRR